MNRDSFQGKLSLLGRMFYSTRERDRAFVEASQKFNPRYVFQPKNAALNTQRGFCLPQHRQVFFTNFCATAMRPPSKAFGPDISTRRGTRIGRFEKLLPYNLNISELSTVSPEEPTKGALYFSESNR